MKATFFTSLFAAAAATTIFNSLPAHAASFGTGGISFDEDTTVDFTFDQSQGEYMSYLAIFSEGKELTKLFAETRPFDASVLKDGSIAEDDMSRWSYDNGANDWRGTAEPGGVVANKTASFTFLKGVTYNLGLVSDSRWFGWNETRNVYSTNSANTEWGGTQQFKFFNEGDQLLAPENVGNLPGILAGNTDVANANFSKGSVLIAIDDRGNGDDKDFNDFRVLASIRTTPVVKDVPEPTAALALLGVGAVGALKLRRRNRQSA